jgi:hemoglobin
MQDIHSKDNIDFLVNTFYKRAIADPLIGHFFTDIVQLNFEHHLPLIISFWDSMLLGANTYKGNPMIKHIELNEKSELLPAHFERWLELWQQSVTENFEGTKANEAVARAKSIALLMQYKIKQ